MIDWETAVKPLLGGTSVQFQPKDVVAVVDAIIKNKDNIFDHDTSNECFYAMFVYLSGYLLSSFEDLIKLEDLRKVSEACQIILEFCMTRIVNFDLLYLCAPKHVMLIMMSLCGKCEYPKENLITFAVMMKSAQIPMSVKMNSDQNQETETSSTNSDSVSVSDMFSFLESEVKSSSAFTQLTELNLKQLHILSTKFELFKSFLQLPYLSRYVNRHKRAFDAFKTGSNKQLVLPLSVNDALAVKNGLQLLQNNLKLVSYATFAPSILNPTNENQIKSNCDVALSCLCAGISVTVGMSVLDHDDEKNVDLQQSREVELMENASNAVKDSICIHKVMRESLKKSENLTVLNNYDLISICCLLKGLQAVIDVSKQDKHTDNKITGKKTSNILMVALVDSLTDQLHDLLSQHSNLNSTQLKDENYLIEDLLQVCDTGKRFNIITKKFNIIDLLLTWTYNCFKQLENIKKKVKPEQKVEANVEVESGSDSGGSEDAEEFGYYDITSSDDSDVSSESGYSEPGSLLGAWMINLMSADVPKQEEEDKTQQIVPEAQLPSLEGDFKTSKSKSQSSKVSKSSTNDVTVTSTFQKLTNKTMMDQCSKILNLFVNYFLKSNNPVAQEYFVQQSDDNMLGKISKMLVLLDKDGSGVGKEGLPLLDLIQKILTSKIFDENRKNEIGNLVLSKSLENSNGLLLGPFAMTIQAQILIQKQQIAVKNGKNDQIVFDFVTSLIQHYEKLEDGDLEKDVKVEVFQLCLFLFHTLNIDGKKHYLKLVVDGIINSKNKPIVSRIRLILLLEYLFHYFSIPFQDILEQVRFNFFEPLNVLSSTDNETPREIYNSAKKYLNFTQNDEADKTLKRDKIKFSLFPNSPLGKEKNTKETTTKHQNLSFHSSVYFELVSSKVRNNSVWTTKSEAFQIIFENKELYEQLYDAFSHNLSCMAVNQFSNFDEKDKIKENDAAIGNQLSEYNFQITWRFASEFPPPNSILNKIENSNLQNAGEILLSVNYVNNKLLTSKTTDTTPTETTVSSDLWEEGVENSVMVKILDENLHKLAKITEDNLKKLIVERKNEPSLIELMSIDCTLTHLKDHFWPIVRTKSKEINPESDQSKNSPMFNNLLQTVLKAIQVHAQMCRSHVLKVALQNDPDNSCKDTSHPSLCALMHVIDVDIANITESTNIPIPFAINQVLISWIQEKKKIKELKESLSTTAGKVKPTIDFYLKVLSNINGEIGNMESKSYSVMLILIQDSLLKLCEDLVLMQDLPPEQIDDAVIPLLADAVFRESQDLIRKSFCIQENKDAEKNDVLNFYALKGAYDILVNHVNPKTGLNNSSVAVGFINFLEEALSNESMQRAMCKFFTTEQLLEEASKIYNKKIFNGEVVNHKGDITKLLLSNQQLTSTEYSNQLLQFIAKLCKTATKIKEPPLELVCSQLCSLKLGASEMRDWVSNFEQEISTPSGKTDDNTALLTLANYIVKRKTPNVQDLANSLLDAILPIEINSSVAMATLLSISPTFVVILATLANAQNGKGHAKVLSYALWWLEVATNLILNEENAEKIHSQNQNEITRAMSTCGNLLFYIGDVLTAIASQENKNQEADSFSSCSSQSESDEESSNEEEEREEKDEEEEGLWNKLCTYTITQKKFMNQHWYQCHTCNMIDGVGVCTICAKVCHKNHDLVYAKYGSFFCDCGAKENKSCKALVKRVPGSDNVASGVSAFSDTRLTSSSVSTTSTNILPSSSTSKTSVNKKDTSAGAKEPATIAAERLIKMVTKKAKSIFKRETTLIGQPLVIRESKESLFQMIGGGKVIEGQEEVTEGQKSIVSTLLKFLDAMKSVVDSDSYKLNSASSTRRALNAINSLHNTDKEVAVVSNLMVPTLGSQEGAFENVKANFTGDQAQTIRQLITSKFIRRVAMCCLSTMTGRKQHLAVSHEKGKVTLLQLSALLKQTDTSKRKLTLTRLSTTAMPFPVTTITANPCNEEVLAVCGLKDCHVLIFASSPSSSIQSGTVTQHLVLHPQLATSNYIVRAKWLPASPSILALITADFIKIYDLSKDVLSPIYYLLLPTGKIRDATIICGVEGPVDTCIIVMSSTGHIYSQLLNDDSLAVHGTFYMTNVLTVKSDLLKENGGQIGGEGVSCFYSHSLKLLFFSYTNGQNFTASLDKTMENVVKLFPIQYKPGNGGSSNSRNVALHEWNEVLNHPGLITCFSHSNGCPVVIMIEPEKIMLQEIKVTSTKSKVIDLVAVRHGSSSLMNEDERTTVIVLCEDGSLRIYLAFADSTRYWLNSRLLPNNILGHSKRSKKSITGKSSKVKSEKEETTFPIDFFEHCQLFNSTDIEFGGQLLEVYNIAQIKNRLNSTGMYVMAVGNFIIEIMNKNPNMVITGVRVLLGTQGGMSCPTHFMIDERYMSLGPRLTRPRWFDIPLSRSESIKLNNKLILFCGTSEDPKDHNMVDSIKVYGKTKEAFGWPQDEPTIGSKPNEKTTKTKSGSDNESEDSTATSIVSKHDLNSGIADDTLLSCLFAVNCTFQNYFKDNVDNDLRMKALSLTSDLLVQPLTLRGHSTVKQVIMRLFNDKNDSYKFQDGQLLKHAAQLLEIDQSDEVPLEPAQIDEEGFQRILAQLSHIARQRPSNLAILENDNTENKQDVELIDLETENKEENKIKEIATKISFHEKVLKGMMTSFWRLLAAKPKSRLLTPPSLPGLTHVEVTVKVMVDIIHAISAYLPETQEMAVKIYFELLTYDDFHVTFAARSALCRLLQISNSEVGQSDTDLKRRSSKMSDTPTSSRSESPPSVSSNQTTTATLATQRGSNHIFAQQQPRPGSHLSSHGTQGETLDDDDEDEDDDFEDLGNDDMAISLDDHVLNETFDVEGQNEVQQNDGEFLQDILPDEMTEADYIRILASNQQEAAQNNEGNQARLPADVMRALATNLPSEHDSLEDQQSIENLLMGIDLEQLLPPDPDDDEAMVEYAIALSLQQQELQQQNQQRQDQHLNQQQQELRQLRQQVREQQRQQIRHQQVAQQENVDQQEIVAQQDIVDQLVQDEQESQQLDEDIERNILLQQRNELRQQIQHLQQQNENLQPEQENVQEQNNVASTNNNNNEESDVDEHSNASLSEGEKEVEKGKVEEEKPKEEKRVIVPKKKRTIDVISEEKLKGLRLLILNDIFSRIREVEDLGGERSIPFFQVISMLISTLDFTNESHIALHRHIVVTIIERVKSVCYENEDKVTAEKIHEQSPKHEVFVIMMRLLSVMMSKSHFPSNQSNKSDPTSTGTSIYKRTASILVQENILDLCHYLLRTLYTKQWEQPLMHQPSAVETLDSTQSGLLQIASKHTNVDMTPFFMPQYVQSYSGALFQPYLRLITEMALNMAAHVMKQNSGTKFGPEWRLLLSDYMLYAEVPSPVRRRVRKLLFHITGSKEKYREERDLHAHANYFATSIKLCKWDEKNPQAPNLTYNELISLAAVIRVCCEIAEKRTKNWQKYCISNPRFLPFLLDTCVNADEGVSSNALTLLLCAITVPKNEGKDKKPAKNESGNIAESSAQKDGKLDVAMSNQIAHRMMSDISDESLKQFVKHFLLEMNVTSIRWSAHDLLLNLFKNSNEESKRRLVNILWSLCSLTSLYGRKAAQFIDILGYLSMKPGLSQEQAETVTDSTLKVLQQQNRLLSNHQNAILYSQLANYVQFDGFYLENNPCLVCNQPEIPFTNIKLSTIKSDTKYTTTQQIIKLIGSYMVQKITIRVTDIKRTKMIRTAVLYYNNKKVPAIVDLKNNPSMWHKAESITVPQGETEIRIELPLPIVATNLMLEFTDFYENVSASIETLQCPRCSASVQANPGICGNCGENVFQCHKCRSINYDEKDPFLCNVCGFSKYAKFDVMVKARPCCAVDSIENDEDRKKMVAYVVTLLDKADTVYNQLNSHKPQLEALLAQISKVSADVTVLSPSSSSTQNKRKPPLQQRVAQPGLSIGSGQVTSVVLGGVGGSNMAPVSSNIQQLAKKYCQECKTLFEELSGIMRTVLASRSEIVEYDKRQHTAATSGHSSDAKPRHVPTSSATWCQSAPDCYGCASASAQQAVTLLRVLATNNQAKPILISKGIIRELVMFNLRRGTAKTRKQVHSLIGQLVKNNLEATTQLNDLLYSRITGAINHHGDNLPSSAVNCEMQLLMSMLDIRDDMWQSRLRNAMKLFQTVVRIKSPAVVENVTLPCVNMIRKLVSPESKNDQQTDPKVSVEASKWLESSDGVNQYDEWRKRKNKINAPQEEKEKKIDKLKIHETFLKEKYAQKWKDFVLKKKKQAPHKVSLSNNQFLRTMLFCPSSRSVRQAACAVVTSLARNTSRKPQVLSLLTSYLDELGNAGEASTEFLALYQEQIRPKQWRVFLAARGVLPLIGNLIQKEIVKLLVLEDTTLNLNLQQGYALKELTELLSELVQVSYVRQHYKGKLVGTVLNSYLSLRRLVIQRTNLVDEAQDTLLDLLEELTTGNESETRSFMEVCIEVIKKQDSNDMKTPQFIFERLANIIYHEENDTSEFFLSLDKDPLQEDFLQGRMVGNPYSSNEAGLGPLMRDVKNKICRDCDLIALLEDDSGMELLINNKIIALDLPVRDVYKKIWLPNHNEEDAMHVVYRMRGLLGEATEDIVERLDSDKTDQNDEEVYKLAGVLSQSGGIEVILSRLESVKSLAHGHQLVDVILKLLSYAVKLKVNRHYLAKPKLNTLNTLLGTLNLGLQAGEEGVAIIDQLLQIMGSILLEASSDKKEEGGSNVEQEEEVVFTGDKKKLTLLLQQIDSEFVQSHSNILQGLLKIIPYLSFGDPDLMQMLIDHFIGFLDFDKYDDSHTDDDTIFLNCFCEIVSGIQFNESGNQLKNLMLENGIVKVALDYLVKHTPDDKNFDSDEWKTLSSKPGLPYCLRMLTGLCTKHMETQKLVGEAIPQLHRLEQISTEEGIGGHAENVLKALQEHPTIALKVKEVQEQTKLEKKKMAMAVRQQQLGALGMHTNEKGQVISKSNILQQISELIEESGLTCIICREGYKFEPKKVLGVYTYTRRCTLEEFENKPRQQQGYSTVSHFNVVHYDCHTAAVRMARGREEWESALLQNASTKCNGLLPLWGAKVPEASFASCLARHNTYIQEATGQREPSFHSTVHDLKLLLLRFAQEKSFSEETGGGGRQSNINLIPYIIHMGLYTINSTRNQAREERIITEFLSSSSLIDKWVESSYEVEGPLFVTSLTPFVFTREKWNKEKATFLKRLLVLAQARHSSKPPISSLTDKSTLSYAVYKPFLLFWALVDCIINILLKDSSENGTSVELATYIRHNDNQLLENGEKMLHKFQDELLPCESLDEFVDVMGCYDIVENDVTAFMTNLFQSSA